MTVEREPVDSQAPALRPAEFGDAQLSARYLQARFAQLRFIPTAQVHHICPEHRKPAAVRILRTPRERPQRRTSNHSRAFATARWLARRPTPCIGRATRRRQPSLFEIKGAAREYVGIGHEARMLAALQQQQFRLRSARTHQNGRRGESRRDFRTQRSSSFTTIRRYGSVALAIRESARHQPEKQQRQGNEPAKRKRSAHDRDRQTRKAVGESLEPAANVRPRHMRREMPRYTRDARKYRPARLPLTAARANTCGEYIDGDQTAPLNGTALLNGVIPAASWKSQNRKRRAEADADDKSGFSAMLLPRRTVDHDVATRYRAKMPINTLTS